MSKKETLHFRIGEDMGILLQNIAHEHLFYYMDPDKAVDAIVGAGCPKEYVVPILKNELFLTTISDSEMGICTKEKLPEGHLLRYHPYDPDVIEHRVHGSFDLLEQGEYLQKNLYQFFSNGLLYVLDIENAEAVFDMPKGWHWKVKAEFTPMDIAKIWMANDFQMQQIIESGELAKCFGNKISNIFNDLEGIRKYVNEGLKLIKFREWMFEHPVCSTKCEGFNRYSEIVTDLAHLLDVLQELDEEGVRLWNEQHTYLNDDKDKSQPNYTVDNAIINKFAGRTAISKLDDFLQMQADQKFRDLTEPVKWDHNWTAGFIDPEGHIYAMDEHESRLAHMDIADAWYEKYPDTPSWDNNLDYSLDRLGWVRFHEGRIRFHGYCLVGCGQAMRDLPFTSRQRDRLAEYTELFYPNGVYNEGLGNNHHAIKAQDWREMSDDELRNIFDF